MFGIYRFLLAFLVVVTHLSMGRLNWWGSYAVFSFYVLSGYLMTMVLKKTYGHTLTGLSHFFINRFLRVYPVYYVVLVFALVTISRFPQQSMNINIALRIPSTVTEWVHNVFIFGLMYDAARLIPSAWSLYVELMFYLAMGMLLVRDDRITLAWFVSSVLYTSYLLIIKTPFADRYYPIAAASLPFSIGAMLFIYRERYHFNAAYHIWLAPILVLSNVVMATYLWGENGKFEVGFYVQILLSVYLIAVLGKLKPRLSYIQTVDRFLGDLAYPVFLCHYHVAVIVSALSGGIADWRLLPLSLPWVILTAYLIHILIERVVNVYRDRLRSFGNTVADYKKLLVIIPDPLSSLIEKGEITERYYNPDNLFDEVHILMCNSDQPDPLPLQKMVGRAHLYLHNLPEGREHFIQYASWYRPWLLKPWAKPFFELVVHYQFYLLRKWAQPAIELARVIKPDLIRCHANDYNAFVARQIKAKLGIPYLVSLHINPDVNPRRRHLISCDLRWEDLLFAKIFDRVEVEGLRDADLVLPVYEPIIPYLKRVGCRRYEVAYNVVSDTLLKKDDYSLHTPIRLISVGRHFSLKNPQNIIYAMLELPNAHLTLVGDGPYQEMLEGLVHDLALESRVVFEPAIPNAELCCRLPEFDIFVIHTEHWEISKAVLEALLTGLPCIINRRKKEQVPELQGDFVMLVDDSKDAYLKAIQKLINDHDFRETLGRRAYAHAQERWAPDKTEAKYAEIYKRILVRRGTRHAD